MIGKKDVKDTTNLTKENAEPAILLRKLSYTIKPTEDWAMRGIKIWCRFVLGVIGICIYGKDVRERTCG
jgi:hypothetical protein